MAQVERPTVAHLPNAGGHKEQSLVQDGKAFLSRALGGSSAAARKFLMDYAYSSVDRSFFLRREFDEWATTVACVPEGQKLKRSEWRALRRTAQRQRRFSPAFVASQRRRLSLFRNTVSAVHGGKVPAMDAEGFPYSVPAPLEPGVPVAVYARVGKAARPAWHTGTVKAHHTGDQTVLVELPPRGEARAPPTPDAGLPSARPADKIAGQRGSRGRGRKRTPRVTVPEAQVVPLSSPAYWYPALRPTLSSPGDRASTCPSRGSDGTNPAPGSAGPSPLLHAGEEEGAVAMGLPEPGSKRRRRGSAPSPEAPEGGSDSEEEDFAPSPPPGSFSLHHACDNGPFHFALTPYRPGEPWGVSQPAAVDAPSPPGGGRRTPSPPTIPGAPPSSALPCDAAGVDTPQAGRPGDMWGASSPVADSTPTSPPASDPHSNGGVEGGVTPASPEAAPPAPEAPPAPKTWIEAMWRDVNKLAAHLVAVRRLAVDAEGGVCRSNPVTGVLGHDHAGLRPALGGSPVSPTTGGTKRSRGGAPLSPSAARAALLRRLQNRRALGRAMNRVASYLASAQTMLGKGEEAPPSGPAGDSGLAAVQASGKGGVPATSPVAQALLAKNADLLQQVSTATAAAEALLVAATAWSRGGPAGTALGLPVPRQVMAGLTVLHLMLMGRVGMLGPVPLWRGASWVCAAHPTPAPQWEAPAPRRDAPDVALRAAATLAAHTLTGGVEGEGAGGETTLSTVGGAEDILGALLSAVHWCAVSLPPSVLDTALSQAGRANEDGVLTCLMDIAGIRRAPAADKAPLGGGGSGLAHDSAASEHWAPHPGPTLRASTTTPTRGGGAGSAPSLSGGGGGDLGDPLVPSPGSSHASSLGGAGPPTSLSLGAGAGGSPSWGAARPTDALVASAIAMVVTGTPEEGAKGDKPALTKTAPPPAPKHLAAFMASPALTAVSEDGMLLGLGGALDLGPGAWGTAH